MHRLGEFILRGRWHAVLIAFALTFIPLLSWLGAVIMGLVTLRKGPKEGGMVALAISLPAIVWAFLGHPQVLLGNVLYGSLLVYIAALCLRILPSWRIVLQVTVLMGIAGVLVTHLVIHDVVVAWIHYYQQLAKTAGQLLGSAGLEQGRENWRMLKAALEQPYVVQTMAKMSTGIFIAFNILGSLLNLVIARLWQAALYNPGGLRRELLIIRLHSAWIGVWLIDLLGIWGHVNLAWDILPLLFLLFLPAGLSVVHASLAKRSKPWFWIISFYAVLILLSPYSVIALILVAVLDSVVDLRQRFSY